MHAHNTATPEKHLLVNKKNQSSSLPTIFTNFCFQCHDQLTTEVVKELQMIISKDDETKGLSLDNKLNSDFLSIMKDHNEHVLNTYPEDSFQ
jgi:hypothetical protein